MDDPWLGLVGEIDEEISGYAVGRYLVLTYGGLSGFVQPYAQATRTERGWLCELASEVDLPSEAWPLDREELRLLGWCPPAPGHEEWRRELEPTVGPGDVLVDGLRRGRCCPHLPMYSWWDGDVEAGVPVAGRAPGPWQDAWLRASPCEPEGP